MTLSQQQIDQIYADLQAAIRVESNSKKARKIEPDFYRKVVDAIDSMNQEADSLIRSNIDRYLRIKERVRQLESDFRTFYILRFGKISTAILPLNGPGNGYSFWFKINTGIFWILIEKLVKYLTQRILSLRNRVLKYL